MKIGILTLPFNNNYGGLLQAYALQSYLENRGHEVYVIRQLFHYNIKLTIKNWIKNTVFYRVSTEDSPMRQFMYHYVNGTNTAYATKGIKSIVNNYGFDAVVVGSDQVWRYSRYINDKYERYFLNFLKSNKKIKKIAFAASFGVDYWEGDDKQTYLATRLIKYFDAVSVREKSGINLCETYLGYNDAVHLLDPTLLHSADFYRQLYNGSEVDNSGKIGVYLLDPDKHKQELVSEFKTKINAPAVIIGKQSSSSNNKSKNYYPSVSQWLKDFDTAKFIITDSFHGMVFSIIFRKPFCVIGNEKRGLDRFNSLLESIQLQDRLIVDINSIDKLNIDVFLSEIDVSFLDKTIAVNRENTDKFLLPIVGL